MKFFKNLNIVTKIILGLIIGAGLGVYVNANKVTYLSFISIFGTLYIEALKAMAPLLVFVLVMDSLASGSSSKKESQGIKTVIILYFVSSLASSVVAVIFSFVYKVDIPGLVASENAKEVINLYDSIKEVMISVVSNPIKAVSDGNYLPVLFWAAMIGLAMKTASKEAKLVLHDFADAITNVIQGIIKFAPLGVMGLIFEAVSTNGPEIFIDYGELIILLVGVMLIVVLVVNPIIVFICTRKNPYPLVFTCLARSGVNAFFTRSSAANIPVNMELCKDLKLDREIYSVTIPLGATINMAGAAVVITIMTLATAWTLHMEVTFPFAIAMSFVATIAAAGSAGTAGGSLMLIPLACSILGIPSEIAWFTVGVGGTIGVIQDSVETAVNSSSDVLLTATADMMVSDKHK